MDEETDNSNTDANQICQALQNSGIHLRTLIETLPDPVWLKDANGFYLCCNHKCESFFGAKESEIIGKTDFDFVDRELASFFRDKDKAAIAAGKPCMNEEEITYAEDGHKEIVETIKTPMFDSNGKLIGVLGIARDITERKRIEKSILESEILFRSIFSQTFQFSGIVELDGTLRAANQTSLDFINTQEQDVIGKPFWNTPWWTHDKKQQEWLRDAISKSTRGALIQHEVTHTSAAGELQYFDFSLKPVMDETGKTIFLIPESRDITERRQAEKLIRESEIRYRELINSMSDGVAVYKAIEDGQDFIFSEINKAGERIGGLTLDQIVGQRVTKVFPGVEQMGLLEVFQRVWNSGQPEEYPDHEYYDSRFRMWVKNYVYKIPSGEIVVVYNDFTKRKQAEEKLINKELEQRQILNTMIDSVITIDQSGTILSFNKAAETLFGYTPDEIIGQSINQLMPVYFESRHNDYMQHFLATGKTKIMGIGREVQGLNKNKDIFPMHLSVAELPLDETGKRRFVGSCHDLTEYKLQEEKIHRSQKMEALGQITGGIAHDFNNMLGIVLGYAELLNENLEDQPMLAKYSHEIHHAGLRGAKLTRKLLSFTRTKTFDEEIIDINTLLQDEQQMLEKTLTSRIKLVLELDKNLWPIWIDESDLEDAIINLAINAMHAIDSGGQLTIQTTNEHIKSIKAHALEIDSGDYVVLNVTDTGCGMSQKTLAKIFEPFFSTKGEKGSGLGLSQVYGFVKRSNGSINVDSEENLGTSFTLYFPRYHDNNTHQSNHRKNIDDYSGNETILIVDDEPALLDLTRERLQHQGYTVICAANSEQALNILEHETIHLLISDIVMPGIDGYRLAQIVQGMYPDIKIQLTTGFEGSDHIEITDDSYHQDLLYKPFESHVLMQKVRQRLDE